MQLEFWFMIFLHITEYNIYIYRKTYIYIWSYILSSNNIYSERTLFCFLSVQGMQDASQLFQTLQVSKDHIMLSSNLDPRAAIKLLGEVKMWDFRRRLAWHVHPPSQRPREIRP